jgi:molybdate transport system substrate-binding protein
MSARAPASLARALVVGGLALVLAACDGSPSVAGAATPARLTIAAASSLRELLDAANASFEAAHPGADVAVSYEASSTLSRQIEEGAAFDAFLSADAGNVDRIAAHVDGASRRVFLSNKLVMVGREGLANPPADPAALATGTWSIAMAGPAVPVGKYARTYLDRKGLLKAVEPRFATADNVRAALALVESGTADVAFVYLTDAKVAKHARLLWTAPPQDDPGIAYVAAATGGSSPLAHAYVEWLLSPEFLKQAEALGFLPPAR